MGARRAVSRQQAGLRFGFVEIFRDCERVPYLDAIVGETRHQDGWREQQELAPRIGIVRHEDFLELEIHEPGEQPPAQRPRRIVLAADAQSGLGHIARSPCRAHTARYDG